MASPQGALNSDAYSDVKSTALSNLLKDNGFSRTPDGRGQHQPLMNDRGIVKRRREIIIDEWTKRDDEILLGIANEWNGKTPFRADITQSLFSQN